MITLRWEQMERAQEVDLLVVAVLCSLDQSFLALFVVFIALLPLSFMVSCYRGDPFARQLTFSPCFVLGMVVCLSSF